MKSESEIDEIYYRARLFKISRKAIVRIEDRAEFLDLTVRWYPDKFKIEWRTRDRLQSPAYFAAATFKTYRDARLWLDGFESARYRPVVKR